MSGLKTFFFGEKKSNTVVATQPMSAPTTVVPVIPVQTFTPTFNPNLTPLNTPTVAVMGGVYDQGLYNELIEKMKAANLPENDFLEFFLSVRGMANLPMDDRTRVMAALAAHVGMEAKQILNTWNHYIDILNTAKKEFVQLKDTQTANEIKTRQSQIEIINRKNSDIHEQIKQLTNTMNANSDTISKISQEISEQQSTIAAAEATFNKTWQTLVDEITTTITRVQAVYPTTK
jgi:hypothetical protein